MITVKSGWPTNQADVAPGVKPYWNYRHEILCQSGIPLKGGRVIIHTSMQSDMLRIIHSSYLGTEKCKCRVRDVLYSATQQESRFILTLHAHLF